jgi:hypothetical protein
MLSLVALLVVCWLSTSTGGAVSAASSVCGSQYDVDHCLGFNEVEEGFTVNGALQPTLYLHALHNYSFAMMPASVEQHPAFALTFAAARASPLLLEGVSGDNPLEMHGQRMTFLPWRYGREWLYYNAVSRSGAGGRVKLINTCDPFNKAERGVTTVCVRASDQQYNDVDDNDGYVVMYSSLSEPTLNPIIYIVAQQTYRFEGQGSLRDQPFELLSVDGTAYLLGQDDDNSGEDWGPAGTENEEEEEDEWEEYEEEREMDASDEEASEDEVVWFAAEPAMRRALLQEDPTIVTQQKQRLLSDDDEFSVTPEVVGPSSLFYRINQNAQQRVHVLGSCVPAWNHFCVLIDSDSAYAEDESIVSYM